MVKWTNACPNLPSLPMFSSSIVSGECPPAGSSAAGASGICSSSQDFPSADRSARSSCRSKYAGSMSLEKLRVSGPSPGNDRAGSTMKGAEASGGLDLCGWAQPLLEKSRPGWAAPGSRLCEDDVRQALSSAPCGSACLCFLLHG